MHKNWYVLKTISGHENKVKYHITGVMNPIPMKKQEITDLNEFSEVEPELRFWSF